MLPDSLHKFPHLWWKGAPVGFSIFSSCHQTINQGKRNGLLSEVGRVNFHFLFDAFFDAVEAFFEVADLVGELPVGVVDDISGLLNNGEDSGFSL